jgi:uncharacterized protein (DUF433 family)
MAGMSSVDKIVKTAGVCGGKTRIAGHRIRVLDIVTWTEHQGMSADEIISHVPTLTLADIYAALAYYFDHIDEIQEEMKTERAFTDEVRRCHSSQLDSKLREERLDKPA